MNPIQTLRQGQPVTLYDKKKRLYVRFRPTNGGFYRMDGSRDNRYFETWPAKLELQDCINLIMEIRDHNLEIEHPGQAVIDLRS